MSSIAENNKRIAKNTVFLYVRMIIMLLVSLYTSRMVLKLLGVTDLGIYNIVGGIVGLLGFVNSSMAIAVQRFLSFDLGEGNVKKLNKTFSMSVMVHLMIALLLFCITETVGLIFLEKYINIPDERMNAAIWVYHFSILATCFNIVRFLIMH